MKVVIMAGGTGERIRKHFPNIPKAMIKIGEKTVIEYQIEVLIRNGFKDIIIVTGYKGEIIQKYISKKRMDANIMFFHEKQLLGTAGSLWSMKDQFVEDFLLINGDIIFDIDLSKVVEMHGKKKALATIVVHPNDHPFDSELIVADKVGKVTEWVGKKENTGWHKNIVNAGIHILSKDILKEFSYIGKVNLDNDILKKLIHKERLYAYRTIEYIKDIGTIERLNEVKEDICNDIVQKRRMDFRKKAVFLDRDGTINKKIDFLCKIEEFKLINGISDFINYVHKKGYLVIVVTNQSVIARGMTSWEELIAIHNKMETLLGRGGAYIDDIFVCPHHPNKGFIGEIKKYKIDCDCRKPKGGMLLEAAQKYNIDLEKSWMIGDSYTDIEAGKSVNAKTYLLNNKNDIVRWNEIIDEMEEEYM